MSDIPKKKKPVYRLWLCGIIAVALITGCGGKNDNQTNNEVESTAAPAASATVKPVDTQVIVTSAFNYANTVVVTDKRETDKLVEIVVHMERAMTSGQATERVLKQAVEFLQQPGITGADTVIIGVLDGPDKVAQFTVDLTKFTPGEDLVKSVLDVSTIDEMSEETKEYGKTKGLW